LAGAKRDPLPIAADVFLEADGGLLLAPNEEGTGADISEVCPSAFSSAAAALAPRFPQSSERTEAPNEPIDLLRLSVCAARAAIVDEPNGS